MDINNCSIRIESSSAIVSNSGISFEEATNARWIAERSLSNSGYIWVQRGHFKGEEIRNVWVNEESGDIARIFITCGSIIYPF